MKDKSRNCLFGYEVNKTRKGKFFVIKKNGRDFWLIEDVFNKALFLYTYPQLTKKAKLYSYLLRLIWCLRLNHILFEKREILIEEDSPYDCIFKNYNEVAIFCGTPGVNRKYVVVANNDDDQRFYFKVPTSSSSKKLVNNEVITLRELEVIDLSPHIIPSVIELSGNFGFMEVPKKNYIGINRFLTPSILDFYEKLYDSSKEEITFNEFLDSQSSLIERIKNLNDFISFESKELIRQSLQEVEIIKKESKLNLEIYKAHGDFTFWNIFKLSDKHLSVIDWEMSSKKTKYFDLIHLIVTNEIFIRKNKPEAIFDTLSREFCFNSASMPDDFSLYFRLYLLQQSLYYLDKYHRQEEDLHEQIHWQINAWLSLLKIVKYFNEKGN
ncbi:hypothetical protein FXE63_13835 [Vibrio mimicus]|uniref:hypothetical protein n=1 Tax=Vibrio mimicus TaxID=674 RepID=UPI0011D91902|nr:hypothetical protein [Vibrio mimicus]TXZ07025.1 hypothetical protein FXE63_13835 [Vibrio mimicus]BCN22638.1 hypothetical protein [Vibrio mimicus]BCN22722.1 hypothetical protein [Vibrio mimicus]